MRRLLLALACPLWLSACSAEVAVDTPPQSASIPITSAGQNVYAEVAIDLPAELQGLDVTVKQIGADFTVHNPSSSLTLQTSARVSLEGNATPDQPKFYTDYDVPAYYATAEELLKSTTFAPNSSTPVSIANSPTLVKAIGQKRIWVIVSNTVTGASVFDPNALPVEIQLQNAVLHA
ncbi:MAG: hypothetical protein ACXU86_04875, partial [Archangium sp.]